MKREIINLLLLTNILLPIMPIQGFTTVTEILTPEADSFVDSYEPTSNVGGIDNIDISNSTSEFTGINIGYFRFNLSHISGPITLAVFKLFSRYITETHSIGIHVCSDNTWNELTINYENKPSYNLTTLDTELVASDSTWYSWTVTGAVQSALTEGKVTFVCVSEDQHIGTEHVMFYSKEENYFTDERPQLEISYDLPTTAITAFTKTTTTRPTDTTSATTTIKDMALKFGEEKTVTIAAQSYQAWSIETTQEDVKVEVKFLCDGCDINFFVADDANFKAWRNGSTSGKGFIYYDKITFEKTITLPEADTWWFVLDNTDSIVTSKTVTISISIVSSVPGFNLVTVLIIAVSIIFFREKKKKNHQLVVL